MRATALIIIAIITLSSCSPIRRLERIQTTEARNLVEQYREMVEYNPENNRPAEVDSINQVVREYLRNR